MNAISTNKLCKQFGTRKAVNNVTLEIPSGAFLSIFGPNGAGKTTLLSLLSTTARASSGEASVAGFDLKEDADEARAHIGLIGHAPMLYPDLTALENLTLYARLYGVPDPEARAMELLETVELKARRFDVVRTFSRGMTQRLSIARALVNDPDVLFLDEPYSGLDPHAADVFDAILSDVRRDRTLCMVSHDLDKGFALATHVLLMARGKQVLFAPKDELDLDEFRATYRQTVGQRVA